MFAKAGARGEFVRVFVADGADGSVLKDAAIAQLELDAPAHRVRLLRVVRGGAPVALDSRKMLARQRVREGSSVILEVMAAPVMAPGVAAAMAPPVSRVLAAPLPPPLALTEEVLGGERIVVASLPDYLGLAVPYPFFLTPAQLAAMLAFVQRAPPRRHTFPQS